MAYQAEYQILNDHIRIEVSGERVPGNVAVDSARVIRRTIELIQQSDIRRCLLVLKLTGPLSALEAYELVTAAEENGWKRDYPLAVANLHAESIDDIQFAEIVAGNRAYPMGVFDTEEDALEWLLS